MKILDAIFSGIAYILHPERPRDGWLGEIKFPTDYTAEEVGTRLDQAAAANPAFKNWRISIVDLMKLTHPDDPDEAASMANRRALASELGRDTYEGSSEDNRWLHGQVFKAIQQRGIPLPPAE